MTSSQLMTYLSWPAVSHNCNATMLPSTSSVFVWKSTPRVEWRFLMNVLLQSRKMKLDLPTAASPHNTTLKTRSGVTDRWKKEKKTIHGKCCWRKWEWIVWSRGRGWERKLRGLQGDCWCNGAEICDFLAMMFDCVHFPCLSGCTTNRDDWDLNKKYSNMSRIIRENVRFAMFERTGSQVLNIVIDLVCHVFVIFFENRVTIERLSWTNESGWNGVGVIDIDQWSCARLKLKFIERENTLWYDVNVMKFLSDKWSIEHNRCYRGRCAAGWHVVINSPWRRWRHGWHRLWEWRSSGTVRTDQPRQRWVTTVCVTRWESEGWLIITQRVPIEESHLPPPELNYNSLRQPFQIVVALDGQNTESPRDWRLSSKSRYCYQ